MGLQVVTFGVFLHQWLPYQQLLAGIETAARRLGERAGALGEGHPEAAMDDSPRHTVVVQCSSRLEDCFQCGCFFNVRINYRPQHNDGGGGGACLQALLRDILLAGCLK